MLISALVSFFMIAFASFVEESDAHFTQSFSSWLKARTEIWTQVTFMRKQYGSRLNVFAPVNDLSSLSKSGSASRSLLPGKKNDVAIAGGQILGDEYSDHVVKNRSGIILRERFAISLFVILVYRLIMWRISVPSSSPISGFVNRTTSRMEYEARLTSAKCLERTSMRLASQRWKPLTRSYRGSSRHIQTRLRSYG